MNSVKVSNLFISLYPYNIINIMIWLFCRNGKYRCTSFIIKLISNKNYRHNLQQNPVVYSGIFLSEQTTRPRLDNVWKVRQYVLSSIRSTKEIATALILVQVRNNFKSLPYSPQWDFPISQFPIATKNLDNTFFNGNISSNLSPIKKMTLINLFSK